MKIEGEAIAVQRQRREGASSQVDGLNGPDSVDPIFTPATLLTRRSDKRNHPVAPRLSVDTVAAGRRELQQAQQTERIRASGGGRPRVEKKTQRSWPT